MMYIEVLGFCKVWLNCEGKGLKGGGCKVRCLWES